MGAMAAVILGITLCGLWPSATHNVADERHGQAIYDTVLIRKLTKLVR